MDEASPIPLVHRQRTLTNIASEYVETRAGKQPVVRLFEVSDGNDVGENELNIFDDFVYSPELDSFVDKDTPPIYSKLYEESRVASELFKTTLKRLIKALKDRGVGEALKIQIKDPKDFTLKYVLELIQKIGDSQTQAAKASTCKNFVRRCCKKVESNKRVIEGVLDILPTDIYGALISGGFSLILIAIEKNAAQREEIQTFLAEIPEKLESIQRLSQVHKTSVELHTSANTVLVATFEVLERIVDKITKTWRVTLSERTEKFSRRLRPLKTLGSSKGKGHTQAVVEYQQNDEEDEPESSTVRLTVPESLAKFQKAVDRFQKQVYLCSEERFGRMEEGLNLLIAMRTERNPQPDQAFARSLANQLFKLYASSPFFDNKTGGVDEKEVEQARLERRGTARPDFQRRNSKLVRTWTEGLESILDPSVDSIECVERVDQLNTKEKDQSQAILHSEEIRDWLSSKESSILTIELETPPDSLDNPLSFASAMLSTTAPTIHKGPILSFFARHRLNASKVNELSTPLSLVTSLNAQLLQYLAENCPTFDLASIAVERFYMRAKKSLSSALKMLCALLEALQPGKMIFLILDCHSSLSGDTDKVFTKLNRLVHKQKDVVFKILVTDPLVGSAVNTIADLSIFVEDHVPGYGTIDPDESTDELSRIIKGTKNSRQVVDEGSVDDDSTDYSEDQVEPRGLGSGDEVSDDFDDEDEVDG